MFGQARRALLCPLCPCFAPMGAFARLSPPFDPRGWLSVEKEFPPPVILLSLASSLLAGLLLWLPFCLFLTEMPTFVPNAQLFTPVIRVRAPVRPYMWSVGAWVPPVGRLCVCSCALSRVPSGPALSLSGPCCRCLPRPLRAPGCVIVRLSPPTPLGGILGWRGRCLASAAASPGAAIAGCPLLVSPFVRISWAGHSLGGRGGSGSLGSFRPRALALPCHPVLSLPVSQRVRGVPLARGPPPPA